MHGSALILGGGVAGLAVANGLVAGGWSVRILERDGGLPASGTALGMWPEALAALDTLGIGERIRDLSQPAHGATLLTPAGRVVATVGGNRSARLIPRPDLLRTLLDPLPAGTVQWDTPVRDADTLPAADVVIGADGINSIVREKMFGTRPPRPLGTVAFRGTSPGPVTGVSETWGDGKLFGLTPHDAGHTNWYACVRTGLLAGDPGDDHAATLRRLFGDWHPAVRRILDSLDRVPVDRRTLYDVGPLPSFVQQHRVLLGDAVHAMAPNVGRGACESLVDAVTLAGALIAAPSVIPGLRGYDRARRRPTRRLVRAGRILNRVSTAVHLNGLRNGVTGLAGRFA